MAPAPSRAARPPRSFSALNLTDREICYKVIRRSVLQKIVQRSERFGFEPEITIKLTRLRCRIYEVPISYSGRDYSEGKKIGWKDGLAAIFYDDVMQGVFSIFFSFLFLPSL